MVDASERLQILLTQEEVIYKTSDYLARMNLESVHRCSASFSSSSSTSPKKRKSCEDDVYEDEQESSSSSCVSPRCRDNDQVGDEEGTTSTQINKHWREKICEWAYQVVDHFDLNREVVSIAMNHLDRFLDTFTEQVDKNTFQLLAMTCLYLSIKLNEYKHLLIPESKSSMDTILRLSRGAFTLPQMEQMEYEVLQRLRWHVHPPTPQLFVKHFLFFLSVDQNEIHDLTQFMIELSVMDYFFVNYKPSEVAVASLLNALQRFYPQTQAQSYFPFLAKFLDMDSPGIVACRERLGLIYAQANDQGVYGTATTDKDASTVSEQSTLHRTTSPVSVMAAPQSYDSNHYNPNHSQSEQGMDMEYFGDDGEL
ncbi:cyclin-like protein [Nitzschia inconspicua]|uniref:Cyclin-like protein n=1 Tax=Nitzschia inconspicua TaxID=303405 RepID=A0A9K3L4A5_9STRA|nr:cyclin-like protein [Nitzschia inconspicua]